MILDFVIVFEIVVVIMVGGMVLVCSIHSSKIRKLQREIETTRKEKTKASSLATLLAATVLSAAGEENDYLIWEALVRLRKAEGLGLTKPFMSEEVLRPDGLNKEALKDIVDLRSLEDPDLVWMALFSLLMPLEGSDGKLPVASELDKDFW